MAIDGYLRGAISQLESALNALQAEVTQIQRDLDGQKNNLGHELDQLDKQRKVHEVTMANDPGASVVMLKHVHDESEAKKARIHQLDNELQSLLQRRSGLHDSVRNFITQLTSLLASPDVH